MHERRRLWLFFFQAEDGIRDADVTGVQTCALPISQAGVGAVATQSLGNTAYGDDGLRLMAMGATAPEAMRIVMRSDSRLSQRQVGMIDAHGNAASWTGDSCFDWAGGRTLGPDGQMA